MRPKSERPAPRLGSIVCDQDLAGPDVRQYLWAGDDPRPAGANTAAGSSSIERNSRCEPFVSRIADCFFV